MGRAGTFRERQVTWNNDVHKGHYQQNRNGSPLTEKLASTVTPLPAFDLLLAHQSLYPVNTIVSA